MPQACILVLVYILLTANARWRMLRSRNMAADF
jgi:hypothetical protein